MSAVEQNRTGSVASGERSPGGLPGAGSLRIGLALLTLGLLLGGVWAGGAAAYLAVALALALGALLVWGWPRSLARERVAHCFLDSALVGVLVASTGGTGSPFVVLYFAAAAGVAWVETRAGALLAGAAVVAGYPLALVAAGDAGALGSPRALFDLGLLAVLCSVAGFAGARVHALRERAGDLASERDREKKRAEVVEAVVSELGPAFEVLDIGTMLQWTAGAARTLAGGSYAHVAALSGNHHRSVAVEDLDLCPTWWHPSVQRLVLWCCREGAVVRSDESVRSVEGFLAVPVGPEEGERWGAIVVGGGAFGDAEERALGLLAEGIGPALERGAEEAPGGRDQVSRLPNRESLRRALQRESAQGRALTVLAVGLGGLHDYRQTLGVASENDLVRRIGAGLGELQQRAFRYGPAEFVVVLSGTGEPRARRTAAAIEQLVARETRGLAGRAGLTVSAGFVFAEARDDDPEAVVQSALRALEKARERADGFAGADETGVPEEDLDGDVRIAGITRSLVEALEARDPYAGGHLRSVSRLSLRMAREMSLDGGRLSALVIGALLHDVGKIGIPDRILHKPERLTEEEYETMKRHAVLGAEILSPVEDLAPAIAVVRYHHERFDGRGYPDGLRAEEIPLAARIVSVADAFDSMVRSRPYGYGITREAAFEELRKNSGTQFDPRAVSALLRVVNEPAARRLDSAG